MLRELIARCEAEPDNMQHIIRVFVDKLSMKDLMRLLTQYGQDEFLVTSIDAPDRTWKVAAEAAAEQAVIAYIALPKLGDS